MRLKLFFLIAIVINACCSAQVSQYPPSAPHPKTVCELPIPTESASFPGGMDNFRRMVGNTIDIKKLKSVKECSAILDFVIERDGSISNIRAQGENELCNQEFIMAVRKVKPKWIPAQKDGTPIREKIRLPFRYVS